MSYCRFSEGDVYLYPHVDGYFHCCGCSLSEDFRGTVLDTLEEVKQHLLEHIAAGDVVPDRALERVEEEIREESDACLRL